MFITVNLSTPASHPFIQSPIHCQVVASALGPIHSWTFIDLLTSVEKLKGKCLFLNNLDLISDKKKSRLLTQTTSHYSGVIQSPADDIYCTSI